MKFIYGVTYLCYTAIRAIKNKKMKLKQLVYTCLVGTFIFGQMSCDIINPEEEIPSYLKIESIEIEETFDQETFGLSSKIVSANVIVDGETAGVINIPGKIPIFAEGDVTITLDPLVQENGASNLLQIYPFFERIVIPATLTRRDSVVVNAKTKYVEGSSFRGSTFSGSDEFFTEDIDENGMTQLNISNIGGQVGEGSVGLVVLNEENPYYEAATSGSVTIDVGTASQIWLEVQYKSDVDFVIGVKDSTGENKREFGIRAKGEWNTIYFNAANLLFANNITTFQLTMTAVLPASWSGEDAEILVDNVKLVYR